MSATWSSHKIKTGSPRRGLPTTPKIHHRIRYRLCSQRRRQTYFQSKVPPLATGLPSKAEIDRVPFWWMLPARAPIGSLVRFTIRICNSKVFWLSPDSDSESNADSEDSALYRKRLSMMSNDNDTQPTAWSSMPSTRSHSRNRLPEHTSLPRSDSAYHRLSNEHIPYPMRKHCQ